MPAEMRTGRVRVKTELAARLLITKEEVTGAIQAETRAPKRRLLLQLLSDGLLHPVSELKALVRDPLPALRALEEKGLVAISDQEVLRQPFARETLKTADPVLTPGQEEALSEILPAIKKGSGAFYCTASPAPARPRSISRPSGTARRPEKGPSC